MKENYLYMYFLMSLKAAYSYPNFADFIAHNNKNLDDVVGEIFEYYICYIKGASPDAYMSAIEVCLGDETDYDDEVVQNFNIDWDIEDLLELVETDGYLDDEIFHN